MYKRLSLILIPLAVSVVWANHVYAETIASSAIVISKVQTGGTLSNIDAPARELIEIHNQTTEPLDLTGWKLEYVSASGKTTTVLVTLQSILPARSYQVASYKSYILNADYYFGTDTNTSGLLAKTGGSVRLRSAPTITQTPGIIVDSFAWGTAALSDTAGSVMAETKAAKELAPNAIAQRCYESPDVLVDTNNNLMDFLYSDSISEIVSLRSSPVCPIEEPDPEPIPDSDQAPQSSCNGAIISELLPNPVGVDTGQEFIELFNPTTATIMLNGCSIQTTASKKVFTFGDSALQPFSYAAFSDNQTGLTLPNSVGGTVWLIDTNNTELQTVTYPANMADGASWALLGSLWQPTYNPTPSLENIAMTFPPCPLGQVRNVETGRCRSILITDVATLTPCKEGQVRNLETNRCRSVVTTAAALKPCNADETRNIDTNRCRKITRESNTLTSCKAGYVRNADTNRCRKVLGASTKTATVKDVRAATNANTRGWWITGGVLLLALLYAVYEWRQDILLRIKRHIR